MIVRIFHENCRSQKNRFKENSEVIIKVDFVKISDLTKFDFCDFPSKTHLDSKMKILKFLGINPIHINTIDSIASMSDLSRF